MNYKKSETYAKVLFEEDSSPEFAEQLKNYSLLFKEEPKVFRFFSLPHLSLEEKQKLLDQALKSTPSLLQNFFRVLLRNKSFSLLPEIQKSYQKLWNDQNKRAVAWVSSTQSLTEEEKSLLKQQLETFFNKKIELKEKEDKSLIAGLKVDIEGYVFEANTSHFLNKFEKSGGF